MDAYRTSVAQLICAFHFYRTLGSHYCSPFPSRIKPGEHCWLVVPSARAFPTEFMTNTRIAGQHPTGASRLAKKLFHPEVDNISGEAITR